MRGTSRAITAGLRDLLPIDPAHLPLERRQQDDIGAFLKRFEQLVLTLQDQLFVGLAIDRAKMRASCRAAT